MPAHCFQCINQVCIAASFVTDTHTHRTTTVPLTHEPKVNNSDLVIDKLDMFGYMHIIIHVGNLSIILFTVVHTYICIAWYFLDDSLLMQLCVL